MKHTGLDNINKPAFDASMKEIRAAIKKDKEIISQIKVIEGESENSYVFPKGVVPLKMYLEITREEVIFNDYAYFDYTYPACLLGSRGDEFQEPYTLSFIEGCVVISGQFEITSMAELIYINANEVDTVEDTLNFNSYDILNPIKVTANPTLAGTENQLTGLQVGSTKFKVSSGTKLYLHELKVKKSGATNPTTLWIISDTNSQATMDTIALNFANATFNFGTGSCLASSKGTIFPKTIALLNGLNIELFQISELVSDTVSEL